METVDLETTILVGEGTKTVVAEVLLYGGSEDGGDVVGSGSSRCHAPDKFDRAIGIDLAVGRALVDLGKQLENSANAEVERRDLERIAREQERARKQLEKNTEKQFDEWASLFFGSDLKDTLSNVKFTYNDCNDALLFPPVMITGLNAAPEEATDGDAQPAKKKKSKKRGLRRAKQ